MTKMHMLLAVSCLSLAACGSEGGATKGSQSADAGAPSELAASTAAPGVLPGGAIDVLTREGWRIDPAVQQADASAASAG